MFRVAGAEQYVLHLYLDRKDCSFFRLTLFSVLMPSSSSPAWSPALPPSPYPLRPDKKRALPSLRGCFTLVLFLQLSIFLFHPVHRLKPVARKSFFTKILHIPIVLDGCGSLVSITGGTTGAAFHLFNVDKINSIPDDGKDILRFLVHIPSHVLWRLLTKETIFYEQVYWKLWHRCNDFVPGK